jgi:hypothetical protein
MLKKLGFKKGSVVECIVTTRNSDGSPNAAPMGVYTLSDARVAMKLHSGSDTLANLLREGCAVLNITYDALLFIKSALLKHAPEVGSSEVLPSKLGAPYLKDAHAYAAVEVEAARSYSLSDSLGESRISVVRCAVGEVKVLRPFPQAPCRGFFAAVELAIDLSRGRREREEQLKRIMRRTLPAREYREVEDFLARLNL